MGIKGLPKPSSPKPAPSTEKPSAPAPSTPSPHNPSAPIEQLADGFTAGSTRDPLEGMGGRGLLPLRQVRDPAQRMYIDHKDDPAVSLTGGNVADLVRRTPQIDPYGINDAAEDENRCGGAAVLNGLLLSGNPRDNARAMRTVLENSRMGLSEQGDTALDMMERGQLKPFHAAVLQYELYQYGRQFTPPGNRRIDGLSNTEMNQVVRNLVDAGAFRDADVRMVNVDSNGSRRGGFHWVAEVTTATGTVTANSWPDVHGYASVANGPASSQNIGSYFSDVTVRRNTVTPHP